MDEECLNPSKRRKIEDAVLQILKASDLETTTEFRVRSAAAGLLGFELSGLTLRRLVRQLIDSFLLSTAADILRTASLHTINDGKITDKDADNHTKQQQRQQKQLSDAGVELETNYNGKVICKLSDKRRVTIHDINGKPMVAIHDFYIKDGNMLPEKGVNAGISLTATQWSSFKNSFPSIQEAILKLESQSRTVAVAKQSEADVSNSMAVSAIEKNQTEAGISDVRSVIYLPMRRKQNESEPDKRNSVADPASEKSQSNSQEHIFVKRKQEVAGTSESIANSDYQEQIPASINETESEISTLVPPFPTQRQHDTVNAVHPENLIPAEGKQTEPDHSTLVPPFHSQGHLHHNANAIHRERLIPIQSARFDGKNYHSWRHQMEFFLNQLNLAYVLSELCPSISLNPEASFEEKFKVEAAIQRWIDDDYLCHHNILNSLCDSLFQLYSQKIYSARELWEELKSVYGDDFGTKRSKINKYIHFQMFDGISILEQVQELHRIADSVIASGTWIEENFHVCVIVSKLPPSWKELRVRLMQEEFLPLNMLMHRLRVEEESRKCYKKETNSNKNHTAEPKLDCRHGMRKNENKRVCYSCGKEGHMVKNCPDRKSEACVKSYTKGNEVVSPCTDTNIVDEAITN